MVSKLRAKTRGKPTADQKLKNRLRYATGPKIEQRLNKELYNKSLDMRSRVLGALELLHQIMNTCEKCNCENCDCKKEE